MRLTRIEIAELVLPLSLLRDRAEATCPLCQKVDSRVHRHYVRTLQDMPYGGKTLRLHLQVCRFFCYNTLYKRKLFAERFPELASVYAHRTTRCTQALFEVGEHWEGRPELF